MRLRLREVELFERDVELRLPFRFGIITLREAPQLLVRARVELQNGSGGWGCSAELLSPKWFDKNPQLTNQQNFEQLRDSVRSTIRLYASEPEFVSPFDLFARCYRQQLKTCAQRGSNALIAGYGPALLDRAILDAACKLKGISVFSALRANLPGVGVTPDIPDLEGFDFPSFLASLTPRASLHARHTVGLIDPIDSSDVKDENRVNDGLPETLEEVIKTYGNRYCKVKVSGQLEPDLARLRSIARLLDRTIDGPYHVTLDGNEQYASIPDLQQLLSGIDQDPRLARFKSSILFIEQPLSRDQALSTDISDLKSDLPVIIDESDDTLEAFPQARAIGYQGVSSKACKGFYKSLINLARCRLWNREQPSEPFFMTAEDLSVQPGISLQQDQAIVALLGIEHVERNGHHYVNGMAGASEREQAAFLAAHTDLYEPGNGGPVRVRMKAGQMRTGSLHCVGFAAGAEPDWGSLSPIQFELRGSNIRT